MGPGLRLTDARQYDGLPRYRIGGITELTEDGSGLDHDRRFEANDFQAARLPEKISCGYDLLIPPVRKNHDHVAPTGAISPDIACSRQPAATRASAFCTQSLPATGMDRSLPLQIPKSHVRAGTSEREIVLGRQAAKLRAC